MKNEVGESKMEWINIFGIVFIVAIMIPNIIYVIKCKDGFGNKLVETIEQIRRLNRDSLLERFSRS